MSDILLLPYRPEEAFQKLHQFLQETPRRIAKIDHSPVQKAVDALNAKGQLTQIEEKRRRQLVEILTKDPVDPVKEKEGAIDLLLQLFDKLFSYHTKIQAFPLSEDPKFVHSMIDLLTLLPQWSRLHTQLFCTLAIHFPAILWEQRASQQLLEKFFELPTALVFCSTSFERAAIYKNLSKAYLKLPFLRDEALSFLNELWQEPFLLRQLSGVKRRLS